MTQALYTSMTGLNAGTEQLTVVSDNVANMNTTAYKTSRVDFQDIWYQTKTTGTNSTASMGGTNPYQVGVGVQCASITKDMEAGSTTSTGKSTDMALTGNGFFTVQNADGEVLYTRDGTFSLDEEGYLVTANGCKVLGMDSTLSSTACTTPIKFPTKLKVIETGSENLSSIKNADLNNCEQITNGSFECSAYDKDGNLIGTETITLSGLSDSTTLGSIEGQLNSSKYFTAKIENGEITLQPKGDAVSLSLETSTTSTGTNFLNQTKLSGSNLDKDGKYHSKVLNYSATITEVDDITSDETILYESFSVGKDGMVTAKYSDGSTLAVTATKSGQSTYFSYTDAAGVKIDDDVNNSGNASLYVNPTILEKANMQLQIATMTNYNGLVNVGNNQYEAGVNCGDFYYTAGGVNGAGQVQTGVLESSNVDLAQQFSNMILAQRLVQANSQVFSGANELLQTLVYLGQ